jgi:hypothetical protein
MPLVMGRFFGGALWVAEFPAAWRHFGPAAGESFFTTSEQHPGFIGLHANVALCLPQAWF